MSDNQLIIEKLDEIKSILLDDRKLSEIVLKLNDILEKVTISPNINNINETNILQDKINTFENNQIKLNQNYEKLIGKPLGLLEIIQKAISDNIDLKKDLHSIQNAINKIKEFEKNKISFLIQENKSIIEEIKTLTPLQSNNEELIESNKLLINQLIEIKNILSNLSQINSQNYLSNAVEIEKEADEVNSILTEEKHQHNKNEEIKDDDLLNEDEDVNINDNFENDFESNDDYSESYDIDEEGIEEEMNKEIEESSSTKTINIDLNQINSQKPIKRTQFDEDYLNME